MSDNSHLDRQEMPMEHLGWHAPIIKNTMAADPQWWKQKGEQAPHAYHITQPERIPSIIQQGLVPWDDELNPEGTHHSEGWNGPRPGHTYFSLDPERAGAIPYDPEENNFAKLRVPTHLFDPKLINPDEDYSSSAQRSTNEEMMQRRKDEHFRSNGELAEAIGLGDKLKDTHRTINKGDSFAYRGSLPADIIQSHGEIYDPSNKQWIPASQWNQSRA
jgi:hypothetical protein